MLSSNPEGKAVVPSIFFSLISSGQVLLRSSSEVVSKVRDDVGLEDTRKAEDGENEGDEKASAMRENFLATSSTGVVSNVGDVVGLGVTCRAEDGDGVGANDGEEEVSDMGANFLQ